MGSLQYRAINRNEMDKNKHMIDQDQLRLELLKLAVNSNPPQQEANKTTLDRFWEFYSVFSASAEVDPGYPTVGDGTVIPREGKFPDLPTSENHYSVLSSDPEELKRLFGINFSSAVCYDGPYMTTHTLEPDENIVWREGLWAPQNELDLLRGSSKVNFGYIDGRTHHLGKYAGSSRLATASMFPGYTLWIQYDKDEICYGSGTTTHITNPQPLNLADNPITTSGSLNITFKDPLEERVSSLEKGVGKVTPDQFKNLAQELNIETDYKEVVFDGRTIPTGADWDMGGVYVRRVLGLKDYLEQGDTLIYQGDKLTHIKIKL